MKKGKLVFTPAEPEPTPPQPHPKEKPIQKKQKKQKHQPKEQPQQREEETDKKVKHSLSMAQNYEESDEQLPNQRILLEEAAEQQEREETKIKHLAICFPDSILEIPQTSALRAYFISEIARISSIFKVDEIIILQDHGYTSKSEKFVPTEYIARNLQYLETPQYLRKHLFKMHPDLNNVGLMNPIEALHHLKTTEVCEFREGVALERPTKAGCGSWVDIGLKQQAKMDQLVLPLTRVTLRLKNYEDPDAPFYEAEAVSKRTPRIQKGLYWGYDVRIAHNLKEMIAGETYDYVMLCNHSNQSYGLPQIDNFSGLPLAQKSVLLFLAGTDDLSTFVEKDERSKWKLEKVLEKFHCSVRLASLGVKQLRLEEQLFLALSRLAEHTL